MTPVEEHKRPSADRPPRKNHCLLPNVLLKWK